jgi:hypothetical protein
MIYDLVNDFEVYLFERPKRLGNFALSIEFDQYHSGVGKSFIKSGTYRLARSSSCLNTSREVGRSVSRK